MLGMALQVQLMYYKPNLENIGVLILACIRIRAVWSVFVLRFLNRQNTWFNLNNMQQTACFVLTQAQLIVTLSILNVRWWIESQTCADLNGLSFRRLIPGLSLFGLSVVALVASVWGDCHEPSSCVYINDLSLRMTKPTKWHVRPVKTQISLGICRVWVFAVCSVGS